MTERPTRQPDPQETPFARQVREKSARKLDAQRRSTRTIWWGLGMMGLVGWSVAIPTVLGAALGVWVDRHFVGPHSWTLMLLVAGLGLGCLNAWHWVSKENREMHESDNNGHG